jgi:hypothetical protein
MEEIHPKAIFAKTAQSLGKAVTEPNVPLNHHSSLKLKLYA